MRDNLTHAAEVSDAALELVNRDRLIRRWRWGSASFFWRAQMDGRLVPRTCDGLLRYAWPDVFAFEGGPPRPGFEAAYRRDLLTVAEVAALCSCSQAKILNEVKSGRLPVRRIGRTSRFVGAEVEHWQHRHWRRWTPGR